MSTSSREALRLAYRADEAGRVDALASELAALAYDRAAATAEARRLVVAVRAQRSHASGVDHLMHEFSLSSQEGVALMCLAEALLRIPDPATADRLIRDKISKGDWKSHLGGSPSLFVNAATWGLMLTGKLVATQSHSALGGALSRLLAKGGEPIAEIMEVAGQVTGDEALVVYAPFEPVPLEGVLGEQGFAYVADQLDGGDWRTTFHRG